MKMKQTKNRSYLLDGPPTKNFEEKNIEDPAPWILNLCLGLK